jgi:excinuclease ABC subunit C
LDNKEQLPDLVLIDGGKGQLNIAKRVFKELGLIDRIDLVSVSKDSNHKSSIIHTINGDTYDILTDSNYQLLGNVQEEVHRFVINFHRKKEGKKLFS